MKTFKTHILLLVVMILSCVFGYSQKPHIHFHKITSENGLMADHVGQIMQDSRGFIWITSRAGLKRYDGHRFKSFHYIPGDSTTIKDEWTFDIFESVDSTIWIYTNQGICGYDPRGEKIIREPSREKYLHQELTQLIGKGDIFRIPRINGGADFVHQIYTIRFLERMNGSIWIFDENEVRIYDPTTKKTTPYPSPNSELSIDGLSDYHPLIEDESGNIWLWSENGISVLRPDRFEITLIIEGSYPIHRRRLIRDNSGNIWWGKSPGLAIYNPKKEKIYEYKAEPNQIGSLHSDMINAIGQDHEGRIWIGTGQGISLVDPFLVPFQHFNKSTNSEEGLLETTVNGAFETEEYIYIISGGINIYSKKDQTFTQIPLEQFWGEFDGIEDGKLIIRDLRKGQIISFDPTDNTIEPYLADHLPKPLPKFTRTYPFTDSRGEEYFFSFEGGISGLYQPYPETGLYRYIPRTNTLKHYAANPDNPDSLAADFNYKIIESSIDNTLWISTHVGGLQRFFPEEDRFETYQHDPKDSSSISSRLPYYLFEDSYQNIWIGHGYGMGVDMIPAEAIRKDSIYFIRYNQSNSNLSNNTVNGIGQDSSGNLWLHTGGGLNRFDYEDEQFYSYPYGHEYIGSPPWSFYQSKFGNLLLGTTQGFMYVKPDKWQEHQKPPEVYITGFKLFNEPVPVYDPIDSTTWSSPLQQSIEFTQAIKLSHKQHDLGFEFAGLNYTYPEKTRYRYRLYPLEEDWIEVGADNPAANYVNVPPGNYTFQVLAANSSGIWNEEGARLEITIAPPWWATPWAYVGYGLLLGLLVWGIVRWRTYALQHQREELRSRVDEQTQELKERNDQLRVAKLEAEQANEAKSTFLSFVSHELRTPLTSILGFASINEKRLSEKLFPLIPEGNPKIDRVKEQVSKNNTVIVQEGQRLADLINDLLDLAKIEAGKMDWQFRTFSPLDLIDRAKKTTFSLFDQNPELSFTTRIPASLSPIHADFDRLLQVILNLISNAVKFTPQGEVTLKVQENASDKTIQFSIQDTGPGISSQNQAAIFERFHQLEAANQDKPKGTGLGLPICKEIVEHHGGRIWVESKVGKGSTFHFTIPLTNDRATVLQNT